MTGPDWPDKLRASLAISVITQSAAELLADAVTEADDSFRSLIESECVWVGDATAENAQAGWWDTSLTSDGMGGSFEAEANLLVSRALSYLDRRGLIERKPGETHLVRFLP